MFFVWKFKTANLLHCSMKTAFIWSIVCLSCNANTIISSIQSNQHEIKRTLFQKETCKCASQWQCECCAKVINDLLNVNQRLCADWTIFSNSWDIQANVRLNNNVLYTNTFSAWKIPPFCIPIWPAIALTGCIQIHSIGQHEFNTLHGCANATVNFIAFNLVNFQMACIEVGAQGIHFIEPNHQIENTTSTEKPPEIELETSDFSVNSSTMRHNFLSTLQSKALK